MSKKKNIAMNNNEMVNFYENKKLRELLTTYDNPCFDIHRISIPFVSANSHNRTITSPPTPLPRYCSFTYISLKYIYPLLSTYTPNLSICIYSLIILLSKCSTIYSVFCVLCVFSIYLYIPFYHKKILPQDFFTFNTKIQKSRVPKHILKQLYIC